MAEVYKAHVLNKPEILLAIKRILPHFSRHQELIKMLINEARLTVGLSHPNIVPVMDFGVVHNNYFLAMEYIPGKDLRSIMTRLKTSRGEIPIPLALHIMIEVLRGLDYAHHKCDNFERPLQLVHRDISPQNIMISFQGQIKILDFGIAKTVEKSRVTETGILKGKFCYMSPEQAHGKNVDPRTDIFSAGIVLWELLTLQSCFRGNSDLEILQRVREGTVESPSAVNPNIPQELSDILMKALQKKVKNRYTTALEFSNALEQYLKSRFGIISQEDVSAFLRGVYPATMLQSGIGLSIPDSDAGTLLPDLEESENSEPSNPQHPGIRAPWAKKERSQWIQSVAYAIPLLILLLVFLGILSPQKVFQSFDRFTIQTVSWLVKTFSPTPSYDPKSLALVLPNSQTSFHFSFSPESKPIVDALPFEIYERIQNRLLYLQASNPMNSSLQQTHYMGYKIIFQMDPIHSELKVQSLQK